MSDLPAPEPATEGVSPRYAAIETWPPAAILDALLENQLAAVAAVRPALPAIAQAAEAAAARLRAGGRLAYCGAGTSGRIATQDAAELTPTFGFPFDRLVMLIAGGEQALVQAVEGAEDDVARGADAAALGPTDVLVAIAASGTTPYTLACVRSARAVHALTIAIANNPGTALLAAAHHPILLPTGPEPIAGSTRMGAGTAQKAALNLFSTLVMTKLGHVHQGQMVGMRATNAKLQRRAVRMLCSLANTGPAQAEAALATAGGDLKIAILLLRGLSPGQAAMELEQTNGVLPSPSPSGRGPG